MPSSVLKTDVRKCIFNRASTIASRYKSANRTPLQKRLDLSRNKLIVPRLEILCDQLRSRLLDLNYPGFAVFSTANKFHLLDWSLVEGIALCSLWRKYNQMHNSYSPSDEEQSLPMVLWTGLLAKPILKYFKRTVLLQACAPSNFSESRRVLLWNFSLVLAIWSCWNRPSAHLDHSVERQQTALWYTFASCNCPYGWQTECNVCFNMKTTW